MFNNLVEKSKEFFPGLEVKYKTESSFMKLIGKILFFNSTFMTSYTTTIGSTIYFPNREFVNNKEVSSSIIFLHELVHIHDAKKISKPLFTFLYLFPQILALLFFPMLFVSWKLALLFLICAAPLPAYFRMKFEKRAYLVSLYVTDKLSKKYNFTANLDVQKVHLLEQFSTSAYYYMWVFKNLNKDFDDGISLIKLGKRPYEDPVFDMLDKLLV